MLPKLAKPCPYLNRLDDVIKDGFCRMCERDVVDLSHLNESERNAFISSTGGKTCISFTDFVKPVVAAAAIAASTAVSVAPEIALARTTPTVMDRSQKGRSTQPKKIPPVTYVPMVTAGAPLPPPPPVQSSDPKPEGSNN